MKISIVHDYLTQYGGAERTLESLAKLWPEAPVYTSIYHREKMKARGFALQQNTVYESFMRKLPFTEKFANTYYLPFYPVAFENFDFGDDVNVVFSVNSYASKAVITKPETLHICYCCTPTRHLWNFDHYIEHHKDIHLPHKLALKPLISYLRLWDQVASTRVDKYVAISSVVRKRIEQIYRRESVVIHPPVNVDKFEARDNVVTSEKNYFLIVSRLGGHKRVDMAIKAFSKLKDQRLVIIGDGPNRKDYERQATENVIFKGWLTDEEIIRYYQNCRAFLYPQEEDFGITAVEAQASGKIVIGYKAGGLLDTVIDGKTGILYSHQRVEELVKAIQSFDEKNFLAEDATKNATKFSEKVFHQKIEKLVNDEWQTKQRELKV